MRFIYAVTNELPQPKSPKTESTEEVQLANASLAVDVTQPDETIAEAVPVFTPNSTRAELEEAPAAKAPPVPTIFATFDIRHTESVEEEQPKWFAALQFLSRSCFCE